MQAKAGVLIEPFVGYALNGSLDVDSSTYDEDYTGTSLGARLGYQMLGLFGGLDYRMNSFTADDDEVTESVYGLVVGYDFPILLRVWGEYVLGGSGEVDFDAGSSIDLNEPSGTVLGVGFTGLPFVSLNFEMANYSYAEYESSGSTTKENVNFTHYLLSVSLPLNL